MTISAATLNQLASALQVVVGPSHVSPGQAVVARVLPPEIPGLPLPDIINVTGAVPPVSFPVAVPLVATVEWILTDDQNQPLKLGSDFIALDGSGGTTAGFLLAPELVELRTPLALEPTIRYVQANVTLRAGDQSLPVLVPPLPVPIVVLPLPVPTVLVLCQHVQFEGQILVIVPWYSLLTSSELLLDVLQSMQAQALQLARFPPFASMLIGLEALSVTLRLPARFLATSPNAPSNGIADFSGISLADGAVGANDRMSSLILLGPHKRVFIPQHPPPATGPRMKKGGGSERMAAGSWEVRGRSVQCFSDANYTRYAFVASVESGAAVLIPNLNDPPIWSIPPAHVKVCVGVPEANFNDALSSVRFAWGLECADPGPET